MALDKGQKVFKNTKFLKSTQYTKETLKRIFPDLEGKLDTLFASYAEQEETHLFLFLALLPLFVEDPDFTSWGEDPEKFLTSKKNTVLDFLNGINTLTVPNPVDTSQSLYEVSISPLDKKIIESLFAQGNDMVHLKNLSMFLLLVLRDFVIDYLQIQQQIKQNVLDTTSKLSTFENKCNTILDTASDRLNENLNSFLDTNLSSLKDQVRQSLGIDVNGETKNGIFRAKQDFFIIADGNTNEVPVEGIFGSSVSVKPAEEVWVLKEGIPLEAYINGDNTQYSYGHSGDGNDDNPYRIWFRENIPVTLNLKENALKKVNIYKVSTN